MAFLRGIFRKGGIMTPTELKQAAERLIELRDEATDGKSFINYSQSNGFEELAKDEDEE